MQTDNDAGAMVAPQTPTHSGPQETPAPADIWQEVRAELRDLRQQISRLGAATVAPPPGGAMAPRAETAQSDRRRAAAVAAETGDRGALMAYLRVRRESAD